MRQLTYVHELTTPHEELHLIAYLSYPYIYIPYYRVFGSLSSNQQEGKGVIPIGALANLYLDPYYSWL